MATFKIIDAGGKAIVAPSAEALLAGYRGAITARAIDGLAARFGIERDVVAQVLARRNPVSRAAVDLAAERRQQAIEASWRQSFGLIR